MLDRAEVLVSERIDGVTVCANLPPAISGRIGGCDCCELVLPEAGRVREQIDCGFGVCAVGSCECGGYLSKNSGQGKASF